MISGASPAMAHRMIVDARQSKSSTTAAIVLPLDRTMRYKLGSDRARLKKIASMQRKAEVKAEIIPDYLPYIEGQMAAGLGDDILTQVMVWALDANKLETFSILARYALDNGVAMPTEFARGLGAWLAESTAKFVLRLADQTISAADIGYANVTALRDLTLYVREETRNMDMHDEIRAKLERACGEILLEESPAPALEHFEAALRLDPHSRVKKRIAALKASQHPQGQAADGSDNTGATPPLAVDNSTTAPLASLATDGAA